MMSLLHTASYHHPAIRGLGRCNRLHCCDGTCEVPTFSKTQNHKQQQASLRKPLTVSISTSSSFPFPFSSTFLFEYLISTFNSNGMRSSAVTPFTSALKFICNCSNPMARICGANSAIIATPALRKTFFTPTTTKSFNNRTTA